MKTMEYSLRGQASEMVSHFSKYVCVFEAFSSFPSQSIECSYMLRWIMKVGLLEKKLSISLRIDWENLELPFVYF